MRIEKKQQEELARRRGLSRKMIFQSIWLLISIGIGYVIARLLFDNDVISPNIFRSAVTDFIRLVSGQSIGIPIWVGWGIMIFLIVLVLQFFFLIGFAFVSEEGRRKPGQASMYSRNKDPFDDRF